MIVELALGVGLSWGIQYPPQDPPAVNLPDIEVTKSRERQREARNFVQLIADPVSRTRSLAIWDSPICVSVENLKPDVAERIEARMRENALVLTVPVAGDDCDPSVIIIATEDGPRTANALVDADPHAFEPGDDGMQQDRPALTAFRHSDDAVRWWTVSMPIHIETGQRLAQLWNEPYPPVIRQTGMHHYNLADSIRGRRQVMQYVVVVVDVRKTASVPIDALADYLSLISFAQISPSAQHEAPPSVLALFDRPQSVTGLTDWDRAYIRSLYGSKVDWSNAVFHLDDIARRMVNELPAE